MTLTTMTMTQDMMTMTMIMILILWFYDDSRINGQCCAVLGVNSDWQPKIIKKTHSDEHLKIRVFNVGVHDLWLYDGDIICSLSLDNHRIEMNHLNNNYVHTNLHLQLTPYKHTNLKFKQHTHWTLLADGWLNTGNAALGGWVNVCLSICSCVFV